MASVGSTRGRGWWLALKMLAAFLLYVGFSWFGTQLAVRAQYDAPVWLGSGLGLALVFLGGMRWCGVIFLASAVFLHLLYGQPLQVAVATAAVNVIAAALGAWGLKRVGFSPRLDRVRDVVHFVVMGLFGAQLCSAIGGSLVLWVSGGASTAGLFDTFSSLWTGNVVGTLFLAPLVLVWSQPSDESFTKGQKIEITALCLCLGVLFVFLFGDAFAELRARSLIARPHTMFPFFVWATLRFGQRGAATISFASLAVLIGATICGAVPFKMLSASRGYEYLQSIVGMLSVTGLFLGAAVLQSQRQREEFRALFEFSGAGHARLDGTGIFQRVNQKLCEILGYSTSELIGRNVSELVHADDARFNTRLQKEVVKSGGSGVYFEKRFIRKDGATIWVAVIATHLPDGEGQGVSSMLVIHDITSRRLAEAELKSAKADAEAANLAKSQFIANISHEIRTPLGAILGFNEFAFDLEQLPADRLLGAVKIKQNGELLLRIINDVLDLTKVEAGRFEVEAVDLDLAELIDDVGSLLGFKAQENGTTLSFATEGKIPKQVVSDPTRLRQILINVIGNAIKFSERGRVEVRLSHQDRALVVSVEDNGAGMTAEQAAHIFQPFQQGDPSMTRRYGGTGLGLALSRQFAQALGGDLVLTRTAVGAGSGFLLTIAAPVVPGAPEFSHQAEKQRVGVPSSGGEVLVPAKRLMDVRALVVDDAFDNRMLVSRFLQREGAQVSLAENGEEAIEKALGGDFDVILMDIQMPGLDGFEATRILRSKGYTRPIVALTAHAMQSDRHRSLGAGCDDHLTKPVNSQALIDAVQQFAAKSVRMV